MNNEISATTNDGANAMTTTTKIILPADPGADPKGAEKIEFPAELPILPLRNTVAFPYTILPLTVGVERSIKLVEDAQNGDHLSGWWP
jgi:ATP-dependent Lon protease